MQRLERAFREYSKTRQKKSYLTLTIALPLLSIIGMDPGAERGYTSELSRWARGAGARCSVCR